MIEDVRNLRERIREAEVRLEKLNAGNSLAHDSISTKFKNYCDLCVRVKEPKLIEVTEKNGEFSFVLKESIQKIMKGPEEKKISHDSVSEQADPDAFMFLIGKVKGLRQAIESGNKRIQYQSGAKHHRQKTLGEEKGKILRKLKESESTFDLLNQKLNEIKKDVKTNILEPIRIEGELGGQGDVQESPFLCDFG